MDIGSTAEKLTRLSDSLWKWRSYVPLIAMTGLCVYLMLDNRKLNLENKKDQIECSRERLQMLERIIKEKEAKELLEAENSRLDKAVKAAEIDRLQTLLNNSR
jgi:hypothetical protein